MLCPVCLRTIPNFVEEEIDGVTVLSCPLKDCGYGVPLDYQASYATHAPLPFSLVGLTGHGKTIFKDSLLKEIENISDWPGFYYNWLDEIEVRKNRDYLDDLDRGRLRDATPEEFQPPQILRLSHVPRLGGCQLMLFDCSGEVWEDSVKIRDGGRYVRHSPSVVWLISLTDLQSPKKLSDMLDIYLHALATMKVDPKTQSIVFTLTKSDLLMQRPGFPEEAKNFLLNDDLDPCGDSWHRLDEVSAALEEWLVANDFHKVVNTAKHRFRAARFCAVSALGTRPGPEMELAAMPRGVLAPLFWTWRLRQPGVWVEDGKNRSLYFSLQEALAQAPPDSTVRLEGAEYVVNESLTVRKPIRLVGAGIEETTLRINTTKYGIGIGIDGTASFANLTIEVDGPGAADVIRVVRGDFHARSCRIRGGKSDAQDRTLGNGLVLANESRGVISECVFASNQRHGLVLRDRSRYRVEKCRAVNNGIAGIYSETLEATLLAGNDCASNRHGMWIKGSGPCVVEANHCHSNHKTGIRLDDTAANVRGNRLIHNGTCGIEATDGGAPVVIQNHSENNSTQGILIDGETSGTFEENVCRANKQAGIHVADQARPTITKNKAEGNSGSGIHFTSKASGICRENTCVFNQSGIRVEGTGSPDLTGNTCEGNTGDGIEVLEKSTPLVEVNSSVRNGQHGMTIAKTAKPRSVRRNSADGNTGKPVNDLRTGFWR